MGTSPAFRSDLSLTLFLSDAADYDGGDLLIETTAGDQAFRLPAGSLVPTRPRRSTGSSR